MWRRHHGHDRNVRDSEPGCGGEHLLARPYRHLDDCPGGSLTIQIFDANTSELLASGNAPFDGVSWNKTLTVPDDIAADQIACGQTLQVALSCRQSGVTTDLSVSPDTVDVQCVSACAVDIGTATAVPSAGGTSGLDQLTVVGTASGCSSVHVVAVPPGTGAPVSTDATVSNGQWTAVFNSGAPGVSTDLKAFHCDRNTTITATCSDGSGCAKTKRVSIGCGTDCTVQVTIEITRSNGRPLRTSNPTCEVADSGDYNLRVVGPSGSSLTVVSWTESSSVASGPTVLQDAQGNNVTSNPLTVTVDYSVASAVNFTFTALVRDAQGCVGTASATFSCGGDAGGDPNAPVDCQVSEWSDFGPCINGQQTRTRSVVTQPRNGGAPCPALTETRSCPPVAVDCQVSAFSNWGPCVDNVQRRTRQVVTQPQNGGRACPALEETRRCRGSAVCDPCCIWNWFNIGLFVVTAIVVFITVCFVLSATAIAAITTFLSGGTLSELIAALLPFEITMVSICLVLLVAGLISWILWLIFCLPNNPNACSMLGTLMMVLSTIVTLSFVLMLILGAISQIACADAAFIDFAWFGILLAITTLIYGAIGCMDHD